MTSLVTGTGAAEVKKNSLPFSPVTNELSGGLDMKTKVSRYVPRINISIWNMTCDM